MYDISWGVPVEEKESIRRKDQTHAQPGDLKITCALKRSGRVLIDPDPGADGVAIMRRRDRCLVGQLSRLVDKLID